MSGWSIVMGVAILACGALRPGEPPADVIVSPDEAISIAVNTLRSSDDGFRLEHPLHSATFTEAGVEFRPRRGGPRWRWSFNPARSSTPGSATTARSVAPSADGSRRVSYRRGAIEERYVFGKDHVEQQFILFEAPAAGGDVVIAGTVHCDGEFASCEKGWTWQTEKGVVSLGKVRAYDAAGNRVDAALSVEAQGTRIVVDGRMLAEAEYPVTIDPEIGTNDFRASDMGLDGDLTYDAVFSAAAYDNIGNRFLVVWEGDDDAAGLGDGRYEIFGQFVDGATGAESGANDFRLSDMGLDGDPDSDAASPAVTFNSVNREFLVVWSGDDVSGLMVNGESEIFGQRVSAVTGAEVGANDFRVSDMGPDGDPLYDALHPSVAYCGQQNEYLVVWEGDDDTAALVEGETEIFAQRLNAATGAEVGTNDFRVSDAGSDGDPLYDADLPAVAFASGPNEYLVVWEGDDNLGGLVEGETEIFGQRISAVTGAEVGANDFRLSDMGPNGSGVYDAIEPSVAYATGENEYFVVWAGDDDSNGVVDGEYEIFGQRVAGGTGAELGTNDLRLSAMGQDGDPLYDGLSPAVAYTPASHEYLVVWEGDTNGGGLGEGEYEIFGQRVSAITGAETGADDFRLSNTGTDGNTLSAALHPDVVFAVIPGQYLVTWEGDDDVLLLADDEYEIFGQRVVASSGVETGVNDFRLSDMGPDGDIDYDADAPAVAYDPTDRQYLIVWQGDDDTAPLVDGETEIFGQRIDAVTGLEIGPNDFRISDMGPDGDPGYDAQSPAVTYNPATREYLVVWAGEEDAGGLVAGEFEIFGQRIDATTGQQRGLNDFRISDMGPDGDPLYDAGEPAVVYNSIADEYLVVWEGDDNAGTLVEGETEIFAQRLSGVIAAEVGTNDFRVSDMGADSNFDFDAAVPAVAHNAVDNQYLVVWAGEDNTGLLVNGEFEIYGQRLAATGIETGANDFRLSDMGPDGDANFDAFAPAVAHDPAGDQYLVVWEGEDNALPLVNGEFEIFGQRVAGPTGTEIGTNDLRVSDMGPDGDPFYDAQSPAVLFSSRTREFVVVWQGDDDTAPRVDGESEIFAQRISAVTGLETGENDFLLSDMGLDGDGLYDAIQPAIAGSQTVSELLVVWVGDDNTGLLGPNEFEVYGQRYLNVETTGVEPIGGMIGRPAIASVTPNPASDEARIELLGTGDGPTRLAVYDVLGRTVLRRDLPAAPRARVSLEIDVSRWPEGVYLARIEGGRVSEARRIVVVR